MLVLRCDQLGNEGGMLTARGAFRALCRARERNQRAIFEIRSDIGSCTNCLRAHRGTVSYSNIATSLAINGQVLRHTALKVEKYTLQNGRVRDLRRVVKSGAGCLVFQGDTLVTRTD
jgi:hypothetical protein